MSIHRCQCLNVKDLVNQHGLDTYSFYAPAEHVDTRKSSMVNVSSHGGVLVHLILMTEYYCNPLKNWIHSSKDAVL